MKAENPFYYNIPAQPEDFVGRWELVDTITQLLTATRPGSCAVIGGKRFGKSSTLRAIEYRLLNRWQQLEAGERYVFPCVIDFKGCDATNEETVYASILRHLYRELKRFENLPLSLSDTDLHTLLNDRPKTIAYWEVEDTLENLCRVFEDQVGLFRLILLLDEGEYIITKSWAETLFSNLRALIHDGPLVNTVQLVLTGSTRVIQVREEGSPLLNSLELFFLQSLLSRDIQLLINRARASDLSEDVGQALQRKSGGHPFIAQYLLRDLWESGLDKPTVDQVEQIATRFRQTRGLDMQGWWQAIGELGQQAYSYLVQADLWPESEWVHENLLLEKLPSSIQPLDQALTGLCYHGLAVREESQKRYRAVNVSFRDWLIHNALLSKHGENPDLHSQAVRLHRLICEDRTFSLDELRTMCFKLNVAYDDLGGEGRCGKARELIMLLLRQRGSLAELIDYVSQKRPHLNV